METFQPFLQKHKPLTFGMDDFGVYGMISASESDCEVPEPPDLEEIRSTGSEAWHLVEQGSR